jgi:hypothetical protein
VLAESQDKEELREEGHRKEIVEMEKMDKAVKEAQASE